MDIGGEVSAMGRAGGTGAEPLLFCCPQGPPEGRLMSVAPAEAITLPEQSDPQPASSQG